MNADDLKIAEAMKAQAKKEIMALREIINWLLKHWDAPQFEDIYRLKRNEGRFEYVPASIQKALVDMANQDLVTPLSVMFNIDEIIEEIKQEKHD